MSNTHHMLSYTLMIFMSMDVDHMSNLKTCFCRCNDMIPLNNNNITE